MDCAFCKRKDTKYRCTLCETYVCNACAVPVDEAEKGYDEGNYRVGKCPREECSNVDDVWSITAKTTSTTAEVAEAVKVKNQAKKKGSGSTGKANIFNFFGKARGKGSSESLKGETPKSDKDLKDSIETSQNSVNTSSFQSEPLNHASDSSPDVSSTMSHPQNKNENSRKAMHHVQKFVKISKLTTTYIRNTKNIFPENSADTCDASTKRR